MTFAPLGSDIFVERTVFLNATQTWPRERLDDLQLRKLQRLAWHVERCVPFYRDVMRRGGFTADDIRSLDDIRRFPLIDKRTIQDNYDAFLPETVPRDRLLNRTTGGSTGTPLTVYSDPAFHARDKANTEHYMNVFGLDIFTHRSVRLYGDAVTPDSGGDPWRVVDGRRMVMSCYAISRATAPAYVAAINGFDPTYIHTRPSAILPLARYVLQDGLPIRPVRFLFCDGEYVTHGQRRTIEQAFQGRLLNVYGHTEGCLVGHPCPFSDSLHFLPQVGLLELLDRDGRPVEEEGGRGEMVATGFNNEVFPLIRYRTYDIGIRGSRRCPCGRCYPILREVEGRVQDYVVDREGTLVPLAPAVFNYNDMDWRGIREFQVVQDHPGALRFLIQPEPELLAEGDAARARIGRRLGGILGRNFTLDVEFVAAIDRTAIGKHRYLRQSLDLGERFG